MVTYLQCAKEAASWNSCVQLRWALSERKDPKNEWTELTLLTKRDENSSDSMNIGTLKGHDIVMVANIEVELCILVDKARERTVADSACSRTVAGEKFIQFYIQNFQIDLQSK